METPKINNIVSTYINTLYTNSNNTETSHLKDMYSKEDYNALLDDVVQLLRENPNADIADYRKSLLEKSGIIELIRNFILERQLAPGLVVSFGTELNRDTLVFGNKQEVLYENGQFVPCPIAMTEDTIFDMASTSKLFTTVSILKLCEAGLIDLEEPIRKYVPDFENLGDITIFDLLTFSTPIRSQGRIDQANTLDEVQRLIFTMVPEENHDPTFPYTDMGSIALKYVIEHVSNMPLREFIQEEILTPCHMNTTFLNVPDDLISRVANENYSSIVTANGKIITTYENIPGTIHDAKTRAMGHNLGMAPGHAGFFSCAEDLNKFAEHIMNYKLLNKESALKIGQNVVGGLVELNSGEIVYNCHHGLLTYTKQADPFFLSHVQPFLSGKSFASPGFAGTCLCVDPLNKVSTFIGGNRLHNRIYSVSPYQNQNIIIYDNKKRAFISPIDGSSKVISKTYSRDGAEITKLAMKLALQYRLLEQVLKQQEELKLVRHI